MAKYIEKRKALLAKVTVTQGSEYAKGWNDAIDAIVKNACDFTDVVEVVRCKDCKWWEKGKDYTPYCSHPVDGLFIAENENNFCSYGERREENGES